jgi:hypothetical protein
MDANLRQYVAAQVGKRIQLSESRSQVRAQAAAALALLRTPRRASLTLTDVPVGTHTEDVSWLVPIAGDYTVVTSPTTAGPFVGLLTAAVQAGSKTPTGCTLIVANRAQVPIGAASIDVLVFPI